MRGFHGPKLTFVVGVEPLKHAQVPPEACLGTPEAHPGAPPTHDFEIWERVKSAWRRKLGMVPRGLEPRTLRLLAVRSNQLSYETLTFSCFSKNRTGPIFCEIAPPWASAHAPGPCQHCIGMGMDMAWAWAWARAFASAWAWAMPTAWCISRTYAPASIISHALSLVAHP